MVWMRFIRALGLIVAGWMLVASAQAQGPAYEVVSVKLASTKETAFRLRFTPDGMTMQNTTPLLMLRAAYSLWHSNDNLFLGLPDWAKKERFDVSAKVGEADVAAYQKISGEQQGVMLQAVLVERFGLVARRETRDGKVYSLVVAKGGVKAKATGADVPGPIAPQVGSGHIAARGLTFASLTSLLGQELGTTVLDRTGLAGGYDVTLDWAPADASGPDVERPSLFTAVQEQLGLRLDAGVGPVEYLVVERIERPAPD